MKKAPVPQPQPKVRPPPPKPGLPPPKRTSTSLPPPDAYAVSADDNPLDAANESQPKAQQPTPKIQRPEPEPVSAPSPLSSQQILRQPSTLLPTPVAKQAQIVQPQGPPGQLDEMGGLGSDAAPPAQQSASKQTVSKVDQPIPQASQKALPPPPAKAVIPPPKTVVPKNNLGRRTVQPPKPIPPPQTADIKPETKADVQPEIKERQQPQFTKQIPQKPVLQEQAKPQRILQSRKQVGQLRSQGQKIRALVSQVLSLRQLLTEASDNIDLLLARQAKFKQQIQARDRVIAGQKADIQLLLRERAQIERTLKSIAQ